MKKLASLAKGILLFCGLALAGSWTKAVAQDTLMVGRRQSTADVDTYLLLYGTNKQLDVQTLAGKIPAADFFKIEPARGFSQKIDIYRHFWLKLLLKNTAPVDTMVYFQFHSHVVDTATLYFKTGQGDFRQIGQTGVDLDFKKRMIPTYDMVFPIRLKSGEAKYVVMKVDVDDGDEFHMFPELSPAKKFQVSEERFYMITGIFTAVMAMVFLLNVLLAIALKRRIHWLYSGYVVVALYEILTMCGADIQFLYPHHPEFSGYFEHLAPCVLGVLMSLIMRKFLQYKERPAIFGRIAHIGMYLIILMTALCLLANFVFKQALAFQGYTEQGLAVVLFIQCLLFLACAIERIKQGFKPARFYLAAIVVFDMGLIQFILMVLFNIDQKNVLTSYPNLIQWGIAWETVVVFIGIVYSYRQLARELDAQKDMLLSSVVAAEEGVRERISQNLHEGVASALGHLSRQLSNTTTDMPAPQLESVLSNSVELANNAYLDVRRISHELAPVSFENDWLIRSLEKTLLTLNQLRTTEFQLYTKGDDRSLPKPVALMVYQILNELISNIMKHAKASSAFIQLFINENSVDIFVEDNGVGFDANHTANLGIGLTNIRSRVAFIKGEIIFDSGEGGTHVTIHVPNFKNQSHGKN
ncbi:hypothetical protein G7092_26515 [Mucilaginibacter sp. HC2]|uniref:sensor histidine kinase n=1 Tax=Mucilaginibacter inviolabilis TaxID=2714892 RepID=UPI00140D7580|nr:7TM diverse intracellular signaling domain-containing protein [Mucilaginibacter inviolabilis]NHA07381.1 hypothetical protein [Mucilaginibacter inviolabilis]